MNQALRHRALAGPARGRLLAALRQAPTPLGLRELAARVGLHPNTAREHLRLLADAGLVTCELAAPRGRGRPGYRYSVERAGTDVGDDPRPYAQLAAVLADQLGATDRAADAATEAGTRWGRAIAAGTEPAETPAEAMARLVRLLDEAGFEPEPPEDADGPIRLRRCPFGRLAVDREPVVCGVHLGLMRGALESMRAPLEATSLEPFVRPDLCLAHLARRAD
jgi:predicted ArsR family transcriptional regulator